MTNSRRVSLGLLALDGASVLLAFNAVGYFRGVSALQNPILSPLFWPMLAVITALYLVDGYGKRADMLSLDYASQHTIALFSAMLFTLLATFAIIPAGYELQSSRIVIAVSHLLLIPMTLAYRRVIQLRISLGRRGSGLVFIGDEASFRHFEEECRATGTVQPLIFVPGDNSPAGPTDASLAHVLEEIHHGHREIEAIILRESARELAPAVSSRLVQLYFSGVPTYTLELFHQVYWRKIPLYRLNQTWLFQEGFQIAREPMFERIKRIADILLAGLGLIIAAPLIAAAGLAVWLGDRGPVFFAQNRVGKNHRVFRLFKLRTMRADPLDGDLYTRKDDPRITRAGRFLRATRLDEFPQLWNVLRGDMSLIGPRAEWDRLVDSYEREIPCYHFRHLVRPGITGWAQVNYPYGANLEDTLRKLEYDLYYIRHFSFTLDASIVLKTVHIMLFGKGR